MNKLTLLATLSSLFLSGCGSFLQTSTYSNTSTPYGNNITATGTAAANAASVNTSYNSPSGAVIGQNQNVNRGKAQSYGGYKKPSFFGEIYDSAARTVAQETSNQINQSIRDVFRGY